MQTLSKRVKNKKGFTLIELIVVIVIIGILAAIAIPSLAGFQANAKYKADIATAKTIATAAQAAITSGANVNTGLVSASSDLNSYFSGGITPNPAYSTASKFLITVTSGVLTNVYIDKTGDAAAYDPATDILVWPNPASATPSGY